MILSTGLYLIKSCLYVLAFYIPFILILRHNTFFTLNRIYLLAGLIFSFVFPLYRGFTALPAYTRQDLPFMEPLVAQTETVISLASEPTNSFNIVALLIILYFLGIAFRLIVLTFSIPSILKLKSHGDIFTHGSVKVVKTNTTVPFSFFNYVFLPKNLDDPGILEHEGAHVRQYHWIDLLLVESVSIILWFNPAMIFYKRALKQQHEYLADRSAIKSGIDMGDYLMSIRRQIELVTPSPLISEFHFLSIKNRIYMLTKHRNPVYWLATYTMVLPLIICLLMAFSPKKHFPILKQIEVDSAQGEISLGLPIDKKNNFQLESSYGERLHPVLGVMRLHTGIDLVTEEGVSVFSTEEGVVVKAELAHSWGNIIIVQHDDTYATSYSHLKAMSVKTGDKVRKGQVIGLVGHTGLSSKDHLHFELHKNGEAIDPIGYLPPMK